MRYSLIARPYVNKLYIEIVLLGSHLSIETPLSLTNTTHIFLYYLLTLLTDFCSK